METNKSIDNFNRQGNDEFNIKEFIFKCLSKWKWFILSLLVFMSFAAYKVSTTHPTYSRYTDILIKNGEQGKLSDQMEKFASMGAFRGNTTVYNEIHAVQSPANIYEVTRRLNLNMNYEGKGTFYNKVLYGKSLPVQANICNIPEEAYAKFTIDLNPDGTYTLHDFLLKYGINEIEDNSTQINGRLAITANSGTAANDTVKTPIGKIVVSPMPHYTQSEEKRTIYVTRNSVRATASYYSAALSYAIKDKEADVITISLTDKSIQRAEDVLNAVIDVYNERWIADKNQIATSTSAFINARLADIAKELENVDSVISTYKSENLLPDVQAATSIYMNKSQRINTEIIDLNNELSISRYIADYLTNNTTKNQILPALQINNNSISAQITEYNRSMLQRNNLVENSSTDNPLVKDLDASLTLMRAAIITSVENQIAALNTQISALQREEQQTTSRIAQSPAQTKFLASEGRNQTVKEQLYLFLLQKREENELSKAFTAYNTRVITPPTGSFAAVGPNRQKIILFHFAIALMCPAALILLIQFMDTKIRGRKDLEGVTLPIVGEIPLSYKKKRNLPWKKHKEQLQVVVKNGNRNFINEAFRVLRTNIEFMLNESNNKVILLTSFNPGSGKSFITMNVGVSLALKGKKVIIIDGDMRHASLSSFISSPKTGLSNYLAGLTNDIDKLIVKNDEYKNLSIIPVGTIPPNPSELLSDKRLEDLVNKLRSEYDYVIIDCPPIDIVTDTDIIEKVADRTMFVVRCGLLERSVVPELNNLENEKRFKNIGIIINGTDISSGRYGYRYGNRYGHGYGYGYGYGYGHGYYSDKAEK